VQWTTAVLALVVSVWPIAIVGGQTETVDEGVVPVDEAQLIVELGATGVEQLSGVIVAIIDGQIEVELASGERVVLSATAESGEDITAVIGSVIRIDPRSADEDGWVLVEGLTEPPGSDSDLESPLGPTIEVGTPEPTAVPNTPTAISTSRPACDPSYPDFCIPPPPPDINCTAFTQRNFRVLAPDPHNLDGNKDGIGCVGPAATAPPNRTATAAPTATRPPSTAVGTAVPTATRTASPLPTLSVSAAAPCQVGQIKGNKNSKIYHVPAGSSYAQTKANVECFDTEAQALAAGYVKAKN
jgi:hypothetical protein